MSFSTYTDAVCSITMLSPTVMRITFNGNPPYTAPNTTRFPWDSPSSQYYVDGLYTWAQMVVNNPPFEGGWYISVTSITQVSPLIFDINLDAGSPLYAGYRLMFDTQIRFGAAGMWPLNGYVWNLSAPEKPVITGIEPDAFQFIVSFSQWPTQGSNTYPIIDYEYSLDGGLTSTSVGTVSPFVITGLSPSTDYSVTLRAVSSLGAGEWSLPFAATTAPSAGAVPYTIYATGDRTIRVIFNTLYPPQHTSSTGYQDALNPRSWGAQIWQDAVMTQLTTLSVTMGETDHIYDILFLESFPAAIDAKLLRFYFVVRSTQIGSQFSSDSYITGCASAPSTSLNAQNTALGLAVRDIANTAITAPGTLIGGDYSAFVGGILPINSSGDYIGQSGEALIRKLVLRRLISKPGDFFHLPKYGAGLGVKETFSTANLRQLAKEIELQALQEPEIERAKATLSYQASAGALVIQVQARMRSTGQQFGLSMNLPLGNSVKF